MKSLLIVIAIGAALTGAMGGVAVESQPANRVREPAVAGLFYPKDADAISKMIGAMLAEAKPPAVEGRLRALVCPHAGYRYSGPVAAFGFKLLQGHEYPAVILLAPSHYFPLSGASVSGADVFRTPLGDVPISEKARTLERLPPFIVEPHAAIHRPDWWPESSRSVPPEGTDTPDTWEHSDEVEVPFLQTVLKNFKLLPVIVGPTDPAAAAKALLSVLDDQTLIVASSDLSHYHPYDEAKQMDAQTIKAICDLDAAAIKQDGACGIYPVSVLVHVARAKGWKTKLLDARNSGDTTGDKSRGVVGYASIAFYEAEQQDFTTADRKLLMSLARKTLTEVVTNGKMPEADTTGLPARLLEKKGCFVTLTENGRLRGCIGHIVPQMPLHLAIMDNARNAAVRDHRFTPVQKDELGKIEIEISVLTEPQPLVFSSPDDLLAKLQPGKDGVVLQIGGNGSTFLPQVWEQIPGKVEFLNALAQKGGSDPGDWRKPGTSVSIYHVEAFKEAELK
jgi:AmmeMemoRadiSam system protein A